MQTYRQLQNSIFDANEKLGTLERALRNLPGFDFIRVIEGRREEDWLMTDTQAAVALSEVLTERDDPMSYEDIEAIFKVSGYHYTSQNIEAARPDSRETIDEEIRRYQD